MKYNTKFHIRNPKFPPSIFSFNQTRLEKFKQPIHTHTLQSFCASFLFITIRVYCVPFFRLIIGSCFEDICISTHHTAGSSIVDELFQVGEWKGLRMFYIILHNTGPYNNRIRLHNTPLFWAKCERPYSRERCDDLLTHFEYVIVFDILFYLMRSNLHD